MREHATHLVDAALAASRALSAHERDAPDEARAHARLAAAHLAIYLDGDDMTAALAESVRIAQRDGPAALLRVTGGRNG